jgi:hypothetical protein
MGIQKKMFEAYVKVQQKMEDDPNLSATATAFNRTMRYVFFVEARRLDKNGRLSGEPKGR